MLFNKHIENFLGGSGTNTWNQLEYPHPSNFIQRIENDFEERDDISKYHPDVKTFEVKEADGSHIGILYTDYFPRESKRAGAWMDVFRKQYKKDGEMVYPIIYNVGNFSKPTGEKPALLSLDEVHTLFHEFGHALHGLLSDCTYELISGTDTPRPSFVIGTLASSRRSETAKCVRHRLKSAPHSRIDSISIGAKAPPIPETPRDRAKSLS